MVVVARRDHHHGESPRWFYVLFEQQKRNRAHFSSTRQPASQTFGVNHGVDDDDCNNNDHSDEDNDCSHDEQGKLDGQLSFSAVPFFSNAVGGVRGVLGSFNARFRERRDDDRSLNKLL